MPSKSNSHFMQYYLISVSFHYPVFADEVVKFHYLKSLGKDLGAYRCRVVTFVLLDDELQLLAGIEPGAEPSPETYLRDTFRTFAENCPVSFPFRKGSEITVKSQCVRDDPSDLSELTVQLHALPRQKGYVRRDRDYWWSGYQTLRGNYRWELMNTPYYSASP